MPSGALLVVGFTGTRAPASLLDAIRGGTVGGVILFKRNILSMVQVAELNQELWQAAEQSPSRGKSFLVSVDQEGGRVARLGSPVLKLPAMRSLAETADIDLLEASARMLGAHLRTLGFTLDFAPVLDVDTNPANPVIGDRSFGRSADEVIVRAGAFARGLRAGGILNCGKHFPGHGDTHLDSHLALPRVDHPRTRLDEVELAPFRALAKELDSIMTAHIVYPALEPEEVVPATLSERIVTRLLREELGFTGVVFSDDLEMKAIADHLSIEDSAVRAVRAGCDALLICSQWELVDRAYAALERASRDEPSFAARVEEASKRMHAMCSRARPQIPESISLETLASVLDSNESRILSARLATLSAVRD